MTGAGQVLSGGRFDLARLPDQTGFRLVIRHGGHATAHDLTAAEAQALGWSLVTGGGHGVDRLPLAAGREHLTVTGQFQSDKYPWCPAGFVAFKIGDPLAGDLLATYAWRRDTTDPEFSRDLYEALANQVRRPEVADQGSPQGAPSDV